MSVVATIGAISTAAGAVPYILAVKQGAVRPRIVSWVVWSVLAGIMAISAYLEGQMPSALLSLVSFVGCTAITLLGWRHSSLRLSKLDIVCLIGAIAGIAALVVFKNPLTAILVAVAVDAIAFVPTLVHAWESPEEESLACFALTVAGGLCALVAANMAGASFVGLAYPLYAVVFNSAMVLLLIVGRFGLLFDYGYGNEEI